MHTTSLNALGLRFLSTIISKRTAESEMVKEALFGRRPRRIGPVRRILRGQGPVRRMFGGQGPVRRMFGGQNVRPAPVMRQPSNAPQPLPKSMSTPIPEPVPTTTPTPMPSVPATSPIKPPPIEPTAPKAMPLPPPTHMDNKKPIAPPRITLKPKEPVPDLASNTQVVSVGTPKMPISLPPTTPRMPITALPATPTLNYIGEDADLLATQAARNANSPENLQREAASIGWSNGAIDQDVYWDKTNKIPDLDRQLTITGYADPERIEALIKAYPDMRNLIIRGVGQLLNPETDDKTFNNTVQHLSALKLPVPVEDNVPQEYWPTPGP